MKRYTFFSLAILFLTVNSALGQLHVLRLDFNGNAMDLSGNNNHGVVHGASLAQDRFGNINSAYSFDGIDDYIHIPYSEVLDLDSNNFALSLWIKTSNTTSPGMIFQKGSKFEETAPQFWIRTNDLSFGKEFVFLTSDGIPPSDYTHVDTSNITDGEWHHITAQRKNDSLEIYCDSRLVSQSFTTRRFLNDTIGIIIGAQNPEPNRNYIHYHFDGMIDDIKLYRTYLSLADIQYINAEEKCTGYVLDTIHVADTVIINDTVTTTIQDTVLVTIHDTLKIDVNITSIDPYQTAEIKVYPNPTKDLVCISNNNYQDMSNYMVRIIDSSSRLVYESYFNQPELMINLSNFGTYGLYYLQLFDNESNLITTRKIVLE